MGSKEERQQLADQIVKGVSFDTVSSFTSTLARDLTGCYFMHLTDKIPPEIKVPDPTKKYLLGKFGSTGSDKTGNKQVVKGLNQRVKGHKSEFKEFVGTMCYRKFQMFDPAYVSEVETELADFFEPYVVKYKSHKEVLYTEDMMERISDKFEILAYKYTGNVYETQKALQDVVTEYKIKVETLEIENKHMKTMTEYMKTSLQDKDKLIEKQERMETDMRKLINMLEIKHS